MAGQHHPQRGTSGHGGCCSWLICHNQGAAWTAGQGSRVSCGDRKPSWVAYGDRETGGDEVTQLC